MDEASKAFFGNPACYMGEGGSIPFMGMLGERFPEAQFLITGVLGPAANPHGPNEFLHIRCAKRLTASVANPPSSSRQVAGSGIRSVGVGSGGWKPVTVTWLAVLTVFWAQSKVSRKYEFLPQVMLPRVGSFAGFEA